MVGYKYEILKKRRQELGLSQTAAAKLIGVSQQHMDRYEKGYPIPLNRILLIEKEFNINRWDLLPECFEPKYNDHFDVCLLEKIITSLEKLILDKNLTFSPEEKARLIVLFYKKFNKLPANDNMDQTISQYTDTFLQEKVS